MSDFKDALRMFIWGSMLLFLGIISCIVTICSILQTSSNNLFVGFLWAVSALVLSIISISCFIGAVCFYKAIGKEIRK